MNNGEVKMKILDDLMSILNFDAEVNDIRLGMFHTGLLTRNCGLAASLPKDALKREGPLVTEPGDLLEKTVQELAQCESHCDHDGNHDITLPGHEGKYTGLSIHQRYSTYIFIHFSTFRHNVLAGFRSFSII